MQREGNTHILTLEVLAALSVIVSVQSSPQHQTLHRSLEKWSKPKWKGSVCLCWPVPWCLTTAYKPSKELPRCCDPLPHGEGLGWSLCSASVGLRPISEEWLCSRGAPKSWLGKWTVSAGEIGLQCSVAFDLFYFPSLSPIVDVDECDNDPCEGKGRCINNYGSYTCHCHSGYSQVITQNRKFCQGEAVQMTAIDIQFPMGKSHHRLLLAFWLSVRAPQVLVCQRYSMKKHPARINAVEHNSHFLFHSPWFSFKLADINECSMPSKCQNGKCVNTEGSYTCECNGGYAKSWRGLCEGDTHAQAPTHRESSLYNSTILPVCLLPWVNV